MIKNLVDLEKYLKEKNYTDDKILEFSNFIKPFFDFYDFMLETHKMDYDMVEQDSGDFSLKILPEYLEKLEKSENKVKFITEINGEIMARYARKYDYEDAESVKTAMNKYSEIFLIEQVTKKKE